MYDALNELYPIWRGRRVRRESFLPTDRTVSLLYPVLGIESVTDLRGERTFVPGRDYVLRDGGLFLPEGSAIRLLPPEIACPPAGAPNPLGEISFASASGGILPFAEGHVFHDMQYAVTYTHAGSWDGPIPAPREGRLPLTKARIRARRGFTVGLLGDSIGAGANSSALTGVPPFAPLWIEQVCLRLSLAVGTTVRCVNRSVGGMDAAWGRSAATGAFAGDVPDLFLIEFGMNDASGKTDRLVFRDNCRAIAEQLLALNPDVELLFVSTTLPNRMARDFVSDHETHEPLLAALADEFGPRADLVPMTSLHRYLLSKKSFWDMTGNNVNHPNDFLVRVYAQAILAVLGIEGGRA